MPSSSVPASGSGEVQTVSPTFCNSYATATAGESLRWFMQRYNMSFVEFVQLNPQYAGSRSDAAFKQTAQVGLALACMQACA
jgi:hypothetical protein